MPIYIYIYIYWLFYFGGYSHHPRFSISFSGEAMPIWDAGYNFLKQLGLNDSVLQALPRVQVST